MAAKERHPPTLTAVSSLKGFEIYAKDGSLGTVSGFLSGDLSRRHVVLGIDRDKVKCSPFWDPSNTVTGELEKQPYSNRAMPS